MTTGRQRPLGLASRLLVAIGIVLATAALTAWAVIAIVGPAVFHEHLARAGVSDHELADLHVEEAFRSSSTVASALAFVAAAIASAAVSIVLTRRIGGSLAAVSTAATSLGDGHYDVRVPSPGLGAEFDGLAGSFNRLADRLETHTGCVDGCLRTWLMRSELPSPRLRAIWKPSRTACSHWTRRPWQSCVIRAIDSLGSRMTSRL